MSLVIPRSLAITDRRRLSPDHAGNANGRAFREVLNGWLEQLVDGAVDALQVREKDLGDRSLFSLVRHVVDYLEALPGRRPSVLVNGRWDIAAAAGADGVHLTGQGIPIPALRRAALRCGRRRDDRPFLFGVSTHTLDDVRRARRQGADYAVFGPLFPTLSKPGYVDVPGPQALHRACRLGLPILALGGIETATQVEVAAAAGAHGIAAIGGFIGDASGLCRAVRRSWPVAAPPPEQQHTGSSVP